MNITTFKDDGVTLIELLVTITILSIIVGIGASSYIGTRNRKVLDGQIKEIVADMRWVMVRSRAQEGGEQWGIHFENSPGDNNDFYEIWSGSSYSYGVVSQRNALSGGVVFTDPPDGVAEDVIFTKSTGLPTSGTTITIKSLTSNDIGTITLSSQGTVDYVISSL